MSSHKAAASHAAGSGHGAALFASYLGWALDAFDFFLVVMTLSKIADTFGRTVEELALSITVTLAFRPVGAFIFGLIADRYGRRIPLMLDLVFYSVIEVLSGLAPNYTTFIILRALFGIGMGAEWGVGASLAMEKVPAKLRGVLSGFLQEGYAAGYLLAAIAYALVFPYWGWRPLFFLGGLPALLALFVRFRVKESEVWQETRHESWRALMRAIASNWKIFLYLVALMTMMNFVSHGTQDLFPTFLEKERLPQLNGSITATPMDTHHLTPQQKEQIEKDKRRAQQQTAVITVISMIGAIIGGLVFGYISDRIGRRKAIAIALLLAIVMIPLWIYAPNVALLAAGAFLMQFMVQGAWGVIPAHLSELSPNSVRGFMPGFAYQVGVLLSSSVGYMEALFGAPAKNAAHAHYGKPMALTALTVFAIGAVVAALGRERRGVSFRADPAKL